MEFVTLWVYRNGLNYHLVVDCVLHFVPLNRWQAPWGQPLGLPSVLCRGWIDEPRVPNPSSVHKRISHKTCCV